MPRSERPLKRGPVIAQPRAGELDTPIIDRVVGRGDRLVVPRGFPHAAEAVDDESVHLTIGIMALTWNRILRDAIDAVASGSALADALPFGGLGGRTDAGDPHSDDALAALADRLGPDDVRHAAAAEVWRRQPQTRLRRRQARHLRPPHPGDA